MNTQALETRFEKTLGRFGQCHINTEMEDLLRKSIIDLSQEIISKVQAGYEPETTMEDLRKIAENYFYEDYLVIYKNKRSARAKAKEKVTQIIEDTISYIQR